MTIPQEIRNRLGLLPHTQVEFELAGDHARIRKSRRPPGEGVRGRLAVDALHQGSSPHHKATQVTQAIANLSARPSACRGALVDNNVLLLDQRGNMVEIPRGSTGLQYKDFKGKEADRLVTRVDSAVLDIAAELRAIDLLSYSTEQLSCARFSPSFSESGIHPTSPPALAT